MDVRGRSLEPALLKESGSGWRPPDVNDREDILKTLLPLLGACLIIASADAMPPAPGLIERLRSEGRLDAVADRCREARERGVNAPFDFDLNSLRRDGSDEVTLRVICILVDFADNQADTQNFPAAHFQEMLFTEGEFPTGSMRDWYLENSYGEMNIIGDVVGWYRMPQDYAYYVAGRNGFGAYPRNAQGLTRDAVLAADGDVDFRNYDNDHNGVVEGLFIVHAGPGAEETGSDDMIWSHSWNVLGNLRPDNIGFRSYAMEPENGEIGVFGHELGHSLFGLPDLYDTNYLSAGVGFWSMMSGGSWGGGGTRPVHFDAWSKTRISFLEPFPIVDDSPDLLLEPVERFNEGLLAWRNNDWGSEYFLIENRQRIGFDESLPASGLLIWHCDDNAPNNAHPWWPGQGDLHNIVALEQADGGYDLEHNVNSGDGSDPWPGDTWNELFSNDTEPDSRDYRGNVTDVTVMNIEEAEAERMRLDVTISPPPEPESPDLFLLERVPANHRFPDPDHRGGADSTDEVALVTRLLHRIGADPQGHGRQLPENLLQYNVVLYIESWRDGDDPAPGLTEDEQRDLTVFLETGRKLVLVGPDVARNLQAGNLLWPYLHAVFEGDGEPRETGNIRRLVANPESRIAGQNFVYLQRGLCDHYVDRVAAGDRAQHLFTDQNSDARGVMFRGPNGYRVILQPALFGGMVDWGGEKQALMRDYFEYLRFSLTGVKDAELPQAPRLFSLIGAYPNPFNGSLQVTYQGAPAGAWLYVFDPLGRRVGKLGLTAGSGSLTWRPAGLAAGGYFLRTSLPDSRPRQVIYAR